MLNNSILKKILPTDFLNSTKHYFPLCSRPPMLPRHVTLQRVPAVEDLVTMGAEHPARLHVARLNVLGQVGGEARLVGAEGALVHHQPLLVQRATYIRLDKIFAA